jgi:hypothetical protein
MRFVQANVIPFSDPGDLPALVDQEVRRRLEDGRWAVDWKRALKIERDPVEAPDIPLAGSPDAPPRPCRWYHAVVRNLHRRKMALNCVAYVVEIRQRGAAPRRPRTMELQWAAYNEPAAAIVPQSWRDLDLGYVLHDSPSVFRFHSHTRSSLYADAIHGPGEFEIDYVVHAENFPPTTATLRLTIGSTPDDIRIVSIEQRRQHKGEPG